MVDGRVYVGTFSDEMLGIDLHSGRIFWRFKDPRRSFPFYASAAVTEERIVVAGRDRMVRAFNTAGGELLWAFAAKTRLDSSPVIAAGRVFFATTGGVLGALDMESGEQVWEFVTGSSITASPSVAGGKLVVGSKEGILYCFGEREPENE